MSTHVTAQGFVTHPCTGCGSRCERIELPPTDLCPHRTVLWICPTPECDVKTDASYDLLETPA